LLDTHPSTIHQRVDTPEFVLFHVLNGFSVSTSLLVERIKLIEIGRSVIGNNLWRPRFRINSDDLLREPKPDPPRLAFEHDRVFGLCPVQDIGIIDPPEGRLPNIAIPDAEECSRLGLIRCLFMLSLNPEKCFT